MIGTTQALSMTRVFSSALAISWAALFSVSMPAQDVKAATVVNTVSYSNGVSGIGRCGAQASDLQRGSETQSLTFSASAAGCNVGGASFAGGGVVGVRGSNDVDSGAGRGVSGFSGFAETIINGLSLSAAAGFTMGQLVGTYGNSIEVGLTPSLDASVSAQIAPSDTFFVRDGSASLTASTFLRGSGGDRDGAVASNDVMVNNVNSPPSESFFFTQPPTLSVMVDVDGLFGVTFRLSGDSSALGYGDTSVNSSFLAFNSLGFSSTGPAFILPDGFTINAPEIGIVDNMWTDSRQLTPVPLPASLPLLLLGIAGIAHLGARRKKKLQRSALQMKRA